MKDNIQIEEDENTVVVTIGGDAAKWLNMMLPHNLWKLAYRKVYKKDGEGGVMEVACEYTEQMKNKLEGQGEPSQGEIAYKKRKKLL